LRTSIRRLESRLARRLRVFGSQGGRRSMNSRQEAFLLWTVIIVVPCLFSGRMRAALRNVVRAPLTPVIVVPLGLLTAWNVVIVLALYRLGFWNMSMLYDTVALVAVGEVGLLFKAVNATYAARFFARWILANFGIMVVLEFVLNAYPFGFWVEFLVVVPLTSILFILAAVPIGGDLGARTHSVLVWIEAVFGLSILAFAVVRAVLSFREFATWQSLESAMLPAVLSVAFLPPLFAWCAWLAYTEAFSALRMFGTEDEPLNHYARKRIVRRFGVRIGALQRFRRTSAFARLRGASSQQDVDLALAEARETR